MATDRSGRIGSAVFDPGGPGISGMDTVANFYVTSEKPTDAEKVTEATVAELNQSFDLVGLDPRGVGASRPAVSCQTDAEWDAFRATAWRTRSQAEVDAANAALKAIAENCVSRTGADEGIDGKTFLANIGTRDVAKDLDVLRAVLGDNKLTYVGFSYGTSIGTVYAEQFPQNVRALVLDGAVDPNQDPLASSLGQAKGFQNAFDEFAAWCVKQSECALGNNADTAVQAYQSLVRPLLNTPLALKDGRVLSFSDANTGVVQALYLEELWPTLSIALQKLSQGDGSIVMFLADFYYERDQTGHYSPALQAFNAVRCVDGPAVTDPAAVTKHNADYATAAPFQSTGDPPGAVNDICAYWPVPPTMQPHAANAPGLPQVLVISTTGDPATPYQQGVDLAKDLGAVLLTVEGTRHTAYLGAGISCVDDIVNKYLITLELPPEGTICP
ncbi:MAG TPA: alpha/beta hydrolase [Nakamurella sp.]|nr:alpha/beta hydrolase [Nakamurella sp.]